MVGLARDPPSGLGRPLPRTVLTEKGVGEGMHPIHEQHLSEPGLVVLDITAPDETTLNTVMAGLQERWATSGITTGQRTPGQPGIRARVHADTRRPGTFPSPDTGEPPR
ncbi:hypothetical protein ACVWXU_000111 [Streptomyces sp. TE33382]